MTDHEYAVCIVRYRREFLRLPDAEPTPPFVLAWRKHLIGYTAAQLDEAMTDLHASQSPQAPFPQNHCRLLVGIISANIANRRSAERRWEIPDSERPADNAAWDREILKRIGRRA